LGKAAEASDSWSKMARKSEEVWVQESGTVSERRTGKAWELSVHR
jgi:hypothetical protein